MIAGPWNVSVLMPMINASNTGVASSLPNDRYPRGIDPTTLITHHVRFDSDGTWNDMDGARDTIQLSGLRKYSQGRISEVEVGVVINGSSSSSMSASSSISSSSESISSSSMSNCSSSSSKYLNAEYEKCWIDFSSSSFSSSSLSSSSSSLSSSSYSSSSYSSSSLSSSSSSSSSSSEQQYVPGYTCRSTYGAPSCAYSNMCHYYWYPSGYCNNPDPNGCILISVAPNNTTAPPVDRYFNSGDRVFISTAINNSWTIQRWNGSSWVAYGSWGSYSYADHTFTYSTTYRFIASGAPNLTLILDYNCAYGV